MCTLKNSYSKKFLVFVVTLTALTFSFGCSKPVENKKFPFTGSKIIIVGGTVSVFSPFGFATETPTQAVISDSRRHVSEIRFPDGSFVPIPLNTKWALQIKPTLLKVGSDDPAGKVVTIQPKTSFDPNDPSDDPADGEGKLDLDKTDPTTIDLTINGVQTSYSFKKGERVKIDYPKDHP